MTAEGMICMAVWEKQTEAMADREDLGDIIVTLLIALAQCLTKCNLRDAVFMWFMAGGAVNRGTEGMAVGPAPDSGGVRLLGHISVNQEEKGMLMLKWLSPLPLLDPSTWDGIAHNQGGSSLVFSQANPWLHLTDALGVS